MATCPDCTTGCLLNGEPTGIISTQGAYFAQAPGNYSLAIRLNCDVWIPDYFAGRPFMSADDMALPPPAGAMTAISRWIRFILIVIRGIPGLIRNRNSVVDERLAKFIHTIQEERKYKKIGAVGYCFGGAAAIRAGSTDLIHTAVVCHPGRFTLDQVKAIKIPTSWVCAQEDMFFSDSFRNKVEAEFAQRKDGESFIDYEFQNLGTTHGFAIRPNLANPELKESYQKAFEQTVGWFNKTLVI
ncbi:hypothetical protein BDZ94DRAFT_1253152 [Collybia nuda]|uniref:Dienelactone hydrolase domain-containing protein n=1 Tax=Collybia nuda TaxID=64659 RepID=A0A9P5YDB3_9AGAR|nr:hypothetical protein BDZ94DRAFT_1253152 [Collybia nuda]